jgi:hypothetical protein
VQTGAPEREIDAFIRAAPAILAVAMGFMHTGHHGTWVLSQQAIRPAIKGVSPGLIPDFLVGARSSDGFEWWVIELKSPAASIIAYHQRQPALSSTTNRGLCQLLTYIDFCAEYQETLRSQFRLVGLREPCGMLFVGKEAEVDGDDAKRGLKAAWNRVMGERLQIRTYSSLLRACRNRYNAFHSDDPL